MNTVRLCSWSAYLLILLSFHSELFALQAYSPLFRRDDPCPPCVCDFRCDAQHPCMFGGVCNSDSGQCSCPETFAGQNCSVPVCQHSASRSPSSDGRCQCMEGWNGAFCDICENDNSCHFGAYRYCDTRMTAQKSKRLFCNVTSQSVTDLLQRASVSVHLPFGTDELKQHGEFQFWVEHTALGRIPLFSCQFNCSLQMSNSNPRYICGSVSCAPDCREEKDPSCSSILVGVLKSIQSEMKFECDETRRKCSVTQQELADLLGIIEMDCVGGECTENAPPSPGPDIPTRSYYKIIALTLLVPLFFFLLTVTLKRRYQKHQFLLMQKFNERDYLNGVRTNMTLIFSQVGYSVDRKEILKDIHGIASPGRLLAIMGGSGAGKSTLLDLLSGKSKRGKVNGEILVNGMMFCKGFKRNIGFVDQEDTLLPTLTVQESLMYSAFLRLSDAIPDRVKENRVKEIMSGLKIQHIAHTRIGNSMMRGISGGEKRRVSIAMELVTDPSILYCDEPTSGLDSYNAFIVMDCLKRLASKSNTTVICTIHQPRSNIFYLFDDLMLLSHGELAYFGSASKALPYFQEIGYSCPAGFNPADFLIDITMTSQRQQPFHSTAPSSHPTSHVIDPFVDSCSVDSGPVELLHMSEEGSHHRCESVSDASDLEGSNDAHTLSVSYHESGLFSEVLDRIRVLKSIDGDSQLGGFSDISCDSQGKMTLSWATRGTASFWKQVLILSKRSCLNLYRNPNLMVGHYLTSVMIGLLLGCFYYQLDFDDIGAIQNRMGALLIMCAFLAFGSLSSLELFISERSLYIHERANGYYFPSSFFLSKIMFDIVPLRVVPPVLMGTISYVMIGLRPGLEHFLFFLWILMLVNLVATSLCLLLGIMVRRVSLGNLLASLFMLISLMLTGIFNNKDSMSAWVLWLRYLSFFNYGYEALCVNELDGMMIQGSIVDSKYTVNARVILLKLGFDPDRQMFNGMVLLLFFLSSQFLAYLCLKLFVKQRR
eukprot:Sdes_comp20725_c2_seq1m16512